MNEEIEKFLYDRGWTTYYHKNYWVHPDAVEDPKIQDYTDYGMTLEFAYKYELMGKPKHKPMGLPIVSKAQMAWKISESLVTDEKIQD